MFFSKKNIAIPILGKINWAKSYKKIIKELTIESYLALSFWFYIIRLKHVGFSYMFVVLVYSLVYFTVNSRSSMVSRLRHIYIGGLTFSIVMMAVVGIYEVVSEGQKFASNGALAGMSGLGHIALSIGLVWTIVKIFQYESAK